MRDLISARMATSAHVGARMASMAGAGTAAGSGDTIMDDSSFESLGKSFSSKEKFVSSSLFESSFSPSAFWTGKDVCRSIAEISSSPIVVLSARNEGGIVESILSMVGIVGMVCDEGILREPDFIAKLMRADTRVELMMSVGVTTVRERVS